jgi:RES domain-containing protein
MGEPFAGVSGFESEADYRNFAEVVLKQRRWILVGKAARFLEAVRAGSKTRERILKSGSRRWRCQVGYALRKIQRGEGRNKTKVEEAWPHPRSRMVPDPKLTGNSGRANPPGFPYLYLASSPETAMAEMRPSAGECLSLGLFEVKRDLKIVTCCEAEADGLERLSDEDPTPTKLDKLIWGDISSAFARHVSRDDRESAYVPTQILAEVFMDQGYQGVAYRSGLAKGTNLVLFNRRAAKCIGTYLYDLKGVRYTFAADEFAIPFKRGGQYELRREIVSEWP